MQSVNLRNVIVSNYGRSDGCCLYASLHMNSKFGETESKEINNSKYDPPKKIEIQEGFVKQAVYLKWTRCLNAKRQEDGPRSSLVIQKRHNNILLPPHTVIKRRTLLWNKRLVRCVSCLPLPPAPRRLREQSDGVLFFFTKQEHANRNTVLRG